MTESRHSATLADHENGTMTGRIAAPGRETDLLVIGAGPVGMAAALLACRAGYTAALLDARDAGSWQNDPRALALSEGSRQLLVQLGAWPVALATPITRVHVSQQGYFGRTQLTAAEQNLPALGYVLPYAEVCAALHAALQRQGIACHWRCPVTAARPGATRITVDAGGQTLGAHLLVHAEGAGDGPGVHTVDYGQDALLARVTPQVPHGGCAWERFTAGGPVALLPQGNDYAMVLVAGRELAEALFAGGSTAVGGELDARFAGRIAVRELGPVSRVPLALRVRPLPQAGHQVWIGNAAQALHPISGQGLNLGLRDAAALGDALVRCRGGDPAAVAAGLMQLRLPDRLATVGFTHGLVGVFGRDWPLLPMVRGLALTAIDLCPPLRAGFGRRMVFGLR